MVPSSETARIAPPICSTPVQATCPATLVRRSLSQLRVQYVLDNDLALVYPLTEELQKIAVGVYDQYDDSYQCHLAISLDESLTNAIVHGNLEISSDQRDDPDFAGLMMTRRLLAPYRDRRVYVDVTFDQAQMMIVVRDEGPGFEVSSVPDPTAAENIDKAGGRGLMLMRHFMNSVVHNAIGNAVTMIKLAPTARS